MKILFQISIFILFLTVNGFAGGPIANDDNFVLEVTSEAIALNVVLNDELTGQEDITVSIISGPEFGTVEVDFKTNSILYFVEGDFEGEVDLVYEVCGTSASCGTVCDQGSVGIKVVRMPLIPEGLTPNGDGLNDVFFFGSAKGFERFELTVVNRWGDLVYQNKDYQPAGFQDADLWGGTYSKTGELLPQGAYYYFIKVFQNGVQVGDPITGVVHIFK